MKRVPYKYLPKFQRRYHPTFRSRFRPRFRATFRPQWDSLIEMRRKPHARFLFHPRWDALLEKRRQQRHVYTEEEKKRLEPILTKEWMERHAVYALEAEEHKKTLKTMKSKVPSNYRPTYHPVYHPIYRSVYSPALHSAHRPIFRPVSRKRVKLKCKYRCTECGSGYLWLNDYLSHIKMEHKGKQPLRLPKIYN